MFVICFPRVVEFPLTLEPNENLMVVVVVDPDTRSNPRSEELCFVAVPATTKAEEFWE
jgi:hypothetical protein